MTRPKVDLHVHSCFSSRPSEWFLQRIGTKESYTDPETIYREAKRRGMRYVTITDHNEIAASLILKEKYPDEVFTGVEVTTYFPENGCKIHVLVYNLSESQFNEINRVRNSIYAFREYLKEQRLPHSVAHATFSINKRLSLECIERLFLLFDCFEGINGARSRMSNNTFISALGALTPERIEQLFRKYRIEPYGDVPWKKGITGGSDDHSGLFIGRTYTEAEAETVDEYVARIQNKETSAGGRHNDYQGLAFAIYKVAYDHSKSRSTSLSPTLFNAVNDLIFERKSIGFRNRLILERMKISREGKENEINRLLLELIDSFARSRELEVERKLDLVYSKIANIADEFFKKVIKELEEHILHGNMIGIIRQISGCIPGIFLSLPFFTTINVLNESRAMVKELDKNYGGVVRKASQRILVFADCMEGRGFLPGIMKMLAGDNGHGGERIVVTCLPQEEPEGPAEHCFMVLPSIHSYELTFWSSAVVRVPSVLHSLRMIYEAEPDEIVVVSPGPLGLLGLLTARLLHIPCTALYHTDIAEEVNRTIGDATLGRFVEDYCRWFLSAMDAVRVVDEDLMSDLDARSYCTEKMTILQNLADACAGGGGAVETPGESAFLHPAGEVQ